MKTSKILFIFLIISAIISSVRGQNHDCLESFSAYDTVTLNGNYLKYHLLGKIAQLEYGNKNF
jgi:hypothetical protein